jgi:hypothetical protein
MKDFICEKTYSTPKVQLAYKTGVFRIEGRSIPENPAIFFEPVLNWLNDYFTQTPQSAKFDFKLDYINSGSSKSIMAILKLLFKFHEKGIDIIVNWHYDEDDESIRDLGKHYQSILKLPFNLIENIA